MKFFSIPLFIALSKPLNIFKMVPSETASRFQVLSLRSLSLLTVYFLIIGYISTLLCVSHSFHFHNILDISTKLPVESKPDFFITRDTNTIIFVLCFSQKRISYFPFPKTWEADFCLFVWFWFLRQCFSV